MCLCACKCVYMSICVCVHVSVQIEELLFPPEMMLQEAVVSHLTWVLTTEPRSPSRAVTILSHHSSSPVSSVTSIKTCQYEQGCEKPETVPGFGVGL